MGTARRYEEQEARRLSIEAAMEYRRTLIGLRDQGRIGDDTLRKLERELDLSERAIRRL